MNAKSGTLNGRLNGNGHRHLDLLGEDHVATSTDTPMKPDAFRLSDAEKIERIEDHFEQIMDILGLDLTDDSLRGTPRRVAKMYVQEIFAGLNPANKPALTLFDNKYKYQNMLVEKGIRVQSFCEHHFLPIYGLAHVGYISSGKVIGLSKINRIVEYYARRPQVQERLTMQIAAELKKVLNTESVAVYIEAKHLCVEARGIEHQGCTTVSSEFTGKFLNEQYRKEFIDIIHN